MFYFHHQDFNLFHKYMSSYRPRKILGRQSMNLRFDLKIECNCYRHSYIKALPTPEFEIS